MHRAADKINARITMLSAQLARFGVSPQFSRFLVSGATTTGVTYLLYLLLLWLGATPVLAYNITFVFGVFFSYFLNLKLTFQTRHSGKKLLSYPLIYIVQYVIGLAVLNIGLFFGLSAEFAVLPVVLINIPITFIMARLLLLR